MSSSDKIKHVIFDFGGVLYEINPLLTLKKFKELSEEPTLFDKAQNFYSEKSDFSKFERGGMSADDFRHAVIRKFKLNASPEDFDNIWNLTLVKLFDGIEDTVKKYKGYYGVHLLSNTNEIHYSRFEPECRSLFSLFSQKIFSCQIGMKKPEPEIFNYALNKIGANPEEVLFIDDTQINTESAARLGMNTYLANAENAPEALFQKIKFGKLG